MSFSIQAPKTINFNNQEQHDELLIKVLRRLAQAGVTLNEKREFSKNSLEYLGPVIFFFF